MGPSVSPLAVPLVELPPVAGVRLGAAAAGLRYQGRDDLVMIELAPATTVAGVFTSNKCPGAPVDWCRAALKGGKARAVVVNAGNANVFTGRPGRDACAATAAAAAQLVGCAAKQVFIASTGVIGELLPYQKLIEALPGVHGGLRDDGWHVAARGIMTTDTFPKVATRTARIGETDVRISGIAKGSGMIAPDMATMLCYVATDARIPAGALQALLKKGDRRRGRELGAHCHGGRQGWRAGGPRQAVDRRGRRVDGPRRRRGSRLRRGAGGGTHEGKRGGRRNRPWPRPWQGHGVDLRSDARLHRHQRVVSELTRPDAPNWRNRYG
jgi:hypothetical protein